ncbi:MAG: CHASE2 domain-containing protein [Porphyrobacter sp. IPPAS B-1204]|nr:MAG: CHASE2 domain-containing protein [Porphyrobacter sp. IPPAS B-1204]
MLSQRRLAVEWLLLLIASVLLAVFAAQGDFTRRLDFSLLDFASSLVDQEPAQDIAIVAIDERSLAAVGEWPWRRATHARLIDNLRKAGAKLVLYDVLLVEPGDPQDDAALAEAMSRHGNVVLPFGFVPTLNRAEGIAPEYPLPAFAAAAAALGHVDMTPDADGVLRRFALNVTIDGQAFPHFVVAGLGRSDTGATMTGIAPGDPWPIVPFKPGNAYPTIPAFAVIDGTVPQALLQGRTVLVGATAQGMGDTHSVPSGDIGLMSGVEAQTNLLDSLRSDGLIRELPLIWAIALAAAALLIQFLGFWKLPARAGLLLTIALISGIATLAITLVPLAQIWLAPGAALLVVALAYPLWSWRRLTVVSGYLHREAEGLMAATGEPAVETGTAGGFDMVARQVNRLRQLVGEVSNALAFIRSAVEASPDATLVLDEHDCVTLANQAALQLFDATPELVGFSLTDLYISQNLAVDPDNAQVTLSDGRVFLIATAQLTGKLARKQGNRIVAFRDITELRRRQRENDELIAFLSHDMRSPQVAIIALTEALGAANADLAVRIRRQAQLTLGLADGFMQLARVREKGASFISHDLSLLLHEAIDQAYPLAARKRITLQRDITGDPVFADIDPGLIMRMAANLIGNAVKFTQKEGVVVVKLALLAADEAQISVADNGPGLPPERMDSPFARFGSRANAEEPSAGLGLAFVKHVVDAHHGEIVLQENPDGGTIFVIRLPLSQAGRRSAFAAQ